MERKGSKRCCPVYRMSRPGKGYVGGGLYFIYIVGILLVVTIAAVFQWSICFGGRGGDAAANSCARQIFKI